MKSSLTLPSSHRPYPRLIDLSLRRIKTLLSRLGNPHLGLPPTVHLAGTNGKGSTLAFLASILEAEGKRVHAYTSPHLIRFNERFLLGGKTATDEQLAKPSRLLAKCPGDVTFFEAATALAFLLFAEEAADFVLLETGLGGRFDATNVIPAPKAAVITPIAVDHTEYLGKNLSSIAAEKAGIIKPGGRVVIAPQSEAVLETLASALRQKRAEAFICGRDWWLEGGRYRRKGLEIILNPSLHGAHQYVNAACAAAVADWALGMPPQAIAEGIASARWPGRLQPLTPPGRNGVVPIWELWADGAHNRAAAEALSASLRGWDKKKTHLIVAMTGGRNPTDFLRPFSSLRPEVWGVGIPSVDCLTPKEVVTAARGLGFRGRVASSIFEPLASIPVDSVARVVICGSLYLVGEALRGLSRNGRPNQARTESTHVRNSA